MEANVGNQDQVDIHLERLENVVRQSETGPNTAHASLALVSPVSRRIIGIVKQQSAGEDSINVVLSSPSATPYFATWARIGAALTSVMNVDPIPAGEQYAILKELAGTFILHASVDRVLGLLAKTTGKLDDAAAHFEDALAFCRKADFRPKLAWTCCDYADLLIDLSTSSDTTASDNRAKAISLLDESLAISTELGMRPLMERARSRPERLTADH